MVVKFTGRVVSYHSGTGHLLRKWEQRLSGLNDQMVACVKVYQV